MLSYREAQSTQAELQWEEKCLQPPACLPVTDFPLVPTLPWRMAFCFVFLAKISKTRPPDKTPIIKPSQLWPRKSKMTKNKQKFGVREETERNSRAQLTFSFPSILLGKGAMWPAAANSCCLPRHEDGTFKLGARIRLFFFYCFYFLNYLITFTHFIWGQCTGAMRSETICWNQFFLPYRSWNQIEALSGLAASILPDDPLRRPYCTALSGVWSR